MVGGQARGLLITMASICVDLERIYYSEGEREDGLIADNKPPDLDPLSALSAQSGKQ